MFFSSIQAGKDLTCYPPAIQKAIRYVMTTDFSALEDGRQTIDGDNMYANVFHVTTKPKAEARPELHKKYIDVQFWVEGEELCGFAPYTGGGTVVEEREDEDVYFYEDFPGESFLCAGKGCYAVFFPNDAHRPGVCTDAGPADIRKVVVKVSVDLI